MVSLDVVATYISEMEPVFADAENELDQAHKRRDGFTAWFPQVIIGKLLQQHAFDEGNERRLAWVQARRLDAVSALGGPLLQRARRIVEPFHRLDSKSSMHISAADVAGGIARYYLGKEDKRLADLFDFIRYNGMPFREVLQARASRGL
jgi:hypothetical protein